MKHYRDGAYITNLDNTYEQLIDEDDYPRAMDDAGEANDANRGEWETLADTAMAHALAEDLVYSRPQAG